ncbi:heavy metal sensor signal transduction histidine kinase [Paraburkholderia caribensis MBA4]|uniref:Sensor protein n=1 Tax=Paraburkholderia caribensis MBA4 TaxID=1323664 RepID=A0A0N7JUE4_9BURK|nr:heavy metal sensor signal transduction histidine kinase [Paraburkholderia caribensis MBA4]
MLIAFYASIAFAISGFAVYEAMMSRVEANATDQMEQLLSALEVHLAELKSTDGIIRDPDAWTEHVHGREYMAFGIFDMAGKELLSTRGFRNYSPVLDVQTPRNPANLSTPTAALRYLVAVVPPDGHGSAAVRVAVQYDSSEERELVRSNAEIIFITGMIGVLLAAISAYGVTMLGLSPLRRIVTRAEQMSIDGLGQPLPKLTSSAELLELGQAFNGMLARLDDSFTRLSEFSSDLAHDLRTPLTNLRTAAQVALAQSRAAPEYREVIESSIDEYERLSRMIDDMLFLARAERADLSLSICEFDTAAQARRVAGFYESLAQVADIAIDVRGHGIIHADLLLYQRAVSNLLANAIAYAPRNSTIGIECWEQPGAVVVLVSDRGPGIAPPHAERIFERFYRADPPREKAISHGEGLGLAIVKSIMNLHHGACGVRSDPAVGTTFWLQFPNDKID